MFRITGKSHSVLVLLAVSTMLLPSPLYQRLGLGRAQAQEPAESVNVANALSAAFEAAAKVITPSVVSVSSVKHAKAPRRSGRKLPDPFFEPFRDFFGDDFFDRFGSDNPEGFSQQGLGTGVIVDEQGHIITNNHVVDGADEVTVRLQNEQTLKAKVIGTDPRTDLAVIKIKGGSLVPAKLGNSDDLKIGEWVVAAGNPFGLENTITAGIVSAKGRSIMGGGQYEDFIQTDAAINPGNSGGPLINLKGDVVGINTAIFSRSGGYMGIGFAIPINMARQVMDSLISKGKVVRGWLGVGIQNLSEDLSRSFDYQGTDGALVGHVEKDGPAQQAGLKQGDIIVRLNGEKIKNINQLRNAVASLTPGQKVEVEVLRNGQHETMRVKVGELPSQENAGPAEQESTTDLGMMVDNLTADLANRLGAHAGAGVIVRSVDPAGPAAQAGIQVRDIIVSLNGKRVKSVIDFNDAVKEADLKKGIRLVVQSEGMERFVFLRSAEE